MNYIVKCIVCGKEIERGTLCGKCMVEKVELARVRNFEIQVCSTCGAVKQGARWTSRSLEGAVEEMVFKNTLISDEFDVKDVLIDVKSKMIVFSGYVNGEFVSVSAPLKYSIKKLSCPKCSRESGGYYESIVQVRANNRELSEDEISGAMEVVENVIRKSKGDEKAFISKIERKREGLNVYLGSRKIGMKIAKLIKSRFGGEITESKKLHTKIDGRDVYRFTYSVKIPEYREGDVVELNGKFGVVKNVQSGKAIDIITGKTINLDKHRVTARKEDMKEGVVVNVDESVAEIVCSDGDVITTERPYGAEIGSEVRVFEKKGRFYAFLKDL
ncbi:60S ribosomal export protein NMD3 [Archaeoglobus neptunius]|uniref:60S ribosomal export protein NMD3 n=1 Tax=Archaeoglobus neptunius TaxID=2798580 RepID=UPI001928F310|nr:NMD3-related protein [Archaeoglobus neptunius]